MSFVATDSRVILFGGPLDGQEADIGGQKEHIKVGGNVYSDSYAIDDNGREVYFCSKGEGKLRRAYAEILLEI